MFHNPTALLYYAEARHADNLRRVPAGFRAAEAAALKTRRTHRLLSCRFMSLRATCHEATTTPPTVRPA